MWFVSKLQWVIMQPSECRKRVYDSLRESARKYQAKMNRERNSSSRHKINQTALTTHDRLRSCKNTPNPIQDREEFEELLPLRSRGEELIAKRNHHGVVSSPKIGSYFTDRLLMNPGTWSDIGSNVAVRVSCDDFNQLPVVSPIGKFSSKQRKQNYAFPPFVSNFDEMLSPIPTYQGVGTKNAWSADHAYDNTSTFIDDVRFVGHNMAKRNTKTCIRTSSRGNNFSSIESSSTPFVHEIENMGKWDYCDNDTFMKHIDKTLGPMHDNDTISHDVLHEHLF
jgi:hypothetical protein